MNLILTISVIVKSPVLWGRFNPPQGIQSRYSEIRRVENVSESMKEEKKFKKVEEKE